MRDLLLGLPKMKALSEYECASEYMNVTWPSEVHFLKM
jgi:hypothetical protein